MIAEGDPVILAMKKRYRNLAMPNLKLNDVDVAALIEYMQLQDKPSTTAKPPRGAAAGVPTPKQPSRGATL